jgi:hypothetical protein
MPDNEIKPRSDIGMSMDPGMLLPHVDVMKPGTPGHMVLESARSAMTTLHKETGLMLDARADAYARQSPGDIAALQRGLKGGKMPTNAVSDGANGVSIMLPNAKELNQAFDLSFKRAATAFDSYMKRATTTHEAIVESVATRIVDPDGTKPANIAAASETRALLRGMKGSDRGALIRTAIEAGDLATAHAVISVAPFLSGMTAQEQAGIKTLVEKKFAADQVAQREASAAVLEKMRNASSAFVDRFSKMKVPERKEEDTALAALRKGVA